MSSRETVRGVGRTSAHIFGQSFPVRNVKTIYLVCAVGAGSSIPRFFGGVLVRSARLTVL